MSEADVLAGQCTPAYRELVARTAGRAEALLQRAEGGVRALPGAGPLLWLRAGFGGQLPQPFAEWPRGLSALPAHMNGRNREEPSRYSELGR